MCTTKGHLANLCRKGGGVAAAGAAGGSGSGRAAKSTAPAIKPKLLSFAKSTKKENTKEGAEGMAVNEVPSVATANCPCIIGFTISSRRIVRLTCHIKNVDK